MDKSRTLQLIQKRQKEWAESRSAPFVPNGLLSNLSDNFFAPLHEQTQEEISEGDGDEFGSLKNPGKMYSLWSSSALACNVFDYWRGRTLCPVLTALRIEGTYRCLSFEQKYPTGVGHKPANLDVMLTSSRAAMLPVAIESKFTEPYQSWPKKLLKDSYFRKPATWDSLNSCRAVGESLKAHPFEYLDAGQLLKHIIALTREFGSRRFILLNVWYDVKDSNAADGYRKEVAEFSRLVAEEVLFRAETYQDVFGRMSPDSLATPYASYLRTRYF
jgi:hypothetical protein